MIKVGQIYDSTFLGGKLVVTWVREDKAEFHIVRSDGFFFIAKELNLGFELIAKYPTWQEAVNSKEFNQ